MLCQSNIHQDISLIFSPSELKYKDKEEKIQ